MLGAWACRHSNGEVVGGNAHAWAIHAALAGPGPFVSFAYPTFTPPLPSLSDILGGPHSLLILTKYTWVLQYEAT